MPLSSRFRWSLRLLPLVALGCGAGEAPPEAPTPPPSDQVVVARVGDQIIGVEDVRRYVDSHGVSPLVALRALEDEALLLGEARRRGWEASASAAQARAEEQLLAQRVLLDIERENPFDAPSQAEVEVYYTEHASEIVRDEQRDCVQVLVEVAEGPTRQDELARAYMDQTLLRMRTEGVNEVWSSQPLEHQGLRVLSQYLPPATPGTPMPDDFRRVIFGVTAPGPAGPVRTPNGWHAVAVTAIHPPIVADSPRALEVARERLVAVRRREALDALLQRLTQRFPIEVSRERIEAVLPALGELLGPAT